MTDNSKEVFIDIQIEIFLYGYGRHDNPSLRTLQHDYRSRMGVMLDVMLMIIIMDNRQYVGAPNKTN
jgi:hypothetical protein